MSDEERLKTILDLKRRKWTLKQIGAKVGMTPSGVHYVLKRAAEGRERLPGEAHRLRLVDETW
jgi:hypothetical protein